MIRHRIAAGIVAGVALVSLAACGSDSKSADTTARAATTTEADSTTSERAATTTEGGSATTSNGSDVSTPLTGECVEIGKDMEQVFGADFDPTKASPEEIDRVFDELKTKAPSELDDDIETLRDAVKPLYAALQKAGGDMTKALQDPDVQQAMTAMNSADVQAASQALDDWTSKGCPS